LNARQPLAYANPLLRIVDCNNVHRSDDASESASGDYTSGQPELFVDFTMHTNLAGGWVAVIPEERRVQLGRVALVQSNMVQTTSRQRQVHSAKAKHHTQDSYHNTSAPLDLIHWH
jgi:hypothetical protein